MFVETRKQGKNKKFYLIHTYRIGNQVKRVARYLGTNLNEKMLEKLSKKAEGIIKQQLTLETLQTELSDEELVQYQRFEEKIDIAHLQEKDWQRFTEQFTYNTNAIEGSTVLYPEVVKLLEHDERPSSSDEQETLNVAEAADHIRKTKESLSPDFMLKLHKICFRNTKTFAGQFRKVEVVIKDRLGNIIHQGSPARDISNLLMELVDWYEKHKSRYPPLFLAVVVHNQFEKVHPFQDGNGRVGRLLLNHVLLRHKHPPVNIYLEDRERYYRCLQKYDETGDVKPMLRFIVAQYLKTYKKR